MKRYCTYVTVYGLVEATDAEAAVRTLRGQLSSVGFVSHEAHAEPEPVSRYTAEQVREILAKRSHRCHRDCKGWDIFWVGPGENIPEIERCDVCADDLDLGDLDIEQLPEAQAALREAREKGPDPIMPDTATDTAPVSFDTALAAFLEKAQAMIDAHGAKNFPRNARKVLKTMPGKRYVRVTISYDDIGRQAYCFIDTTNGDVLKPDGWKGPAKGARGNIYALNPISGVTPYGAARR